MGNPSEHPQHFEAPRERKLSPSVVIDSVRSDLRRVFPVQDHRLRRSRLPLRAPEAVGIFASLLAPGRCIAVPMVFYGLVQDQVPG